MDSRFDDLFVGVAVIIDDEVNDNKSTISKIVSQISSLNIPILKYDKMPSDEEIKHFANLSFVLLDWKLETESLPTGGHSAELEKENDDNIRNFIKKLKEVCYCPILIFSNEEASALEMKLTEFAIIKEKKPSNIFIQNKSDLQITDSFKSKIVSWMKKTPSVYLLKEWEIEYHKSKTKLFYELQEIDPCWPMIMLKCYVKDDTEPRIEFRDLIARNIFGRMTEFAFNTKLIDMSSTAINKNELRMIIEGTKIIKKDENKKPMTGDIYRKDGSEPEETEYYINIRAQCDLLREEDPYIYLLKGKQLIQNSSGKITEAKFEHGEFQQRVNHEIISFIDDGKIIEFQFKEFSIKKFSSLETEQLKKIGRLIPPYITRIQQRFSHYFQRQGLPSIPVEAI